MSGGTQQALALAWQQQALALPLWGLLGLSLLMFGLAWACAARRSAVWRQALCWVAAYNLIEGVALLLISRHGQPGWPAYLTGAVGSALTVPAYVALWQAASWITGADRARRERWLVTLVGVAATLWLGAVAGDQQRMAGSLLATAYVSLRGGWQIGQRLALAGQPWLSRAVQLVGWSTGIGLAARGAMGLWLGDAADNQYMGMTLLAYLTMCTGLLANMVVAYVVFGRMMHALDRLSSADPLQVLPGPSVLRRLLLS